MKKRQKTKPDAKYYASRGLTRVGIHLPIRRDTWHRYKIACDIIGKPYKDVLTNHIYRTINHYGEAIKAVTEGRARITRAPKYSKVLVEWDTIEPGKK